ncbi:uncharacterized protein BCR38DRAFT_330542 [Pseudomassariella vexata]|uniref:2EXR domain-containing protein n=1 Tax=Pseudomassariella vexata TaxID=1141098 RepID=A0A1Y2EKS1_9PEZI|nr:uncharacterized protein BCR38DRAFT_330542 [Pseudomassariella vexata]ORY71445.1 hypothetical protein BCR38DRAFT_330542 [Pseudomassariella vexata]
MDSETSDPQASHATARQFTLFPTLPAELRIKIWRHSFCARVLELHFPRFSSHYARDKYEIHHWQSNSANPVGLSVCVESRMEALSYYFVALPLHNSYRFLYLNPAVDTVVILGDAEYQRMTALLATVQAQDPTGRGMQRIGLSVMCWAHEFAGAMLRWWSKTLFSQVEEFVLLMYTERLPPSDFRGGECVLEDCQGMERYLRFVMGRGREPKDGEDWMVFGRAEMRIMNLGFVPGPGSKPSISG